MPKPIVNPQSLRVVILAPTGQDATLIAQSLTGVGIHNMICRSLPEVTDTLKTGAGAVLLAEEALQSQGLNVFIQALGAQPPWSDLPITLLTRCGASQRAIHKVSEQFEKIANFTVLERPLHVLTLTSILRAALRSRARQYEVRDLVERLTTSQIQLQEKNRDLEEFHDVVIGRELRMIELEKQVEELRIHARANQDGQLP